MTQKETYCLTHTKKEMYNKRVEKNKWRREVNKRRQGKKTTRFERK